MRSSFRPEVTLPRRPRVIDAQRRQNSEHEDPHHEDSNAGRSSASGYRERPVLHPSREHHNSSSAPFENSPSAGRPTSANSSSPTSGFGRPKAHARVGNTDPVGLTVLHEPEDAPLADVVFVHNLGGGSLRTWTDEDRTGTLWPQLWLSAEPLLASTRISSYGYNAHFSAADPDRLLDISGFAKDLLTKLRFSHGREGSSLNIGSVPLIFVAHSLGGLLVKKAYLLAINDPKATYTQIAQATAAFVFFSTPHRGLHTSYIVNNILLACVDGWRHSFQADPVEKHLAKLQDINEKFRDVASSLEIYSFYEQPLAQPSSVFGEFIMPQEVATLDHPSESQMPLDADHASMTKYSSRTDPDYVSVRAVLQSLLENFKTRGVSRLPDNTPVQSEEVKNFLLGADAPQNAQSLLSDIRIEGSCQWVLRHPTMKAFLDNDISRPRVLWCFGSFATGKSVTTSYIIEQLLEDEKACTYYYFHPSYRLKDTWNTFLKSIAWQMSQYIPEYMRKLFTLARDSFDVGKAGHKLLWEKLVVATLLQCGVRLPFYIIIDGLDDFPQAKELVQNMLIDLENVNIPLRLLLVSRPTLEIATSVNRLAKRVDVENMVLDNNAEDLEMYVRREMGKMLGDDDWKEGTVSEILTKADGNFVWASRAVHELLNCASMEESRQALQQVPTALDSLYERMDVRLADTLRSRPEDQVMGHTIIMWACCAKRPLQLDELEMALKQDFPRILDMRQTIQNLCGEFVSVDRHGHTSMMHASAREFLMSKTHLNYHVSVKKAHHALFSRCIQALTLARRVHGPHHDSNRLFHLYAASSWPFHLTQSSDFEDQTSLTLMLKLLGSRSMLGWMVTLAQSSNLRAIVEASQALSELLKVIDRADRHRSPLMHRLADKELLRSWMQDLIRVVGKFGIQITRHPRSVYRLMPAFCPSESVFHRQFIAANPTSRENTPLVVRGNLSTVWDDCFTKFLIAGDSLPNSIMSLDRYFAILTKNDGTVHLHYSATCEVARRLCHGEHVLTLCVDLSITCIATYGFSKTMVWDIESGRLLFSMENPSHTKALAMTFQRNSHGDKLLLTFSDDRVVRSCALGAMRVEWERFGGSLDRNSTHSHQVNAPHNAQFSPDGLYIAISYRGANPAVWFLGGIEPQFVAQFDHRARRSALHLHDHTRVLYVVNFAWNPLTGHLLGTFYGGMVFKWHPQEGDYALSTHKGESIKCSVDGKIFITGGHDGTMRIWDFEHFTPIYQLRYPLRIQDLDLGRNEARVYDIRERCCNIWEPSSLLRALESDSRSRTESEQSSLAAESVREQEDFEPITALSVQSRASVYAIGDDSGKITISNFDGVTLAEITVGPMSIEQLQWSEDAITLASVDLGRDITIRRFGAPSEIEQSFEQPKILQSLSEAEEVRQILLDVHGERLVVVTPTALKVHRTSANEAPIIRPLPQGSRWAAHPGDQRLLFGFGASQVTLIPWADPLDAITLQYEEAASSGSRSDSAAFGSLRLPNPRRPSQAYPASPSEVDQSVRKVCMTSSGTLAMIEIYGISLQARRRSACLLMETNFPDNAGGKIPVSPVPSEITEILYTSLGFIDAESLNTSARAGSFSSHRRGLTRGLFDLSTFVFVDKDFWVCSADIGFAQTQKVEVRKHFFLPRDWQNSEWLEMATVTSNGHVLCPRNGNVATISNGLVEEFEGADSV